MAVISFAQVFCYQQHIRSFAAIFSDIVEMADHQEKSN